MGGARVALGGLQLLHGPDEGSRAAMGSEAVWRGSGSNLGNHVFVEASRRALRDRPFLFPYHTADGALLHRVADVLVVPAANWISPFAELGPLCDVVEAAGRPTLVLGLGIQAALGEEAAEPHPSVLRFLGLVSDLCPPGAVPFLVRGRQTKDTLGRLGFGPSAVVGCPSALLSHRPGLGRRMAGAYGRDHRYRALLVGNPGIEEHRAWNLYAYRAALEGRGHVALVVQEDLGLLSLVRNDPVPDAWVEKLAGMVGTPDAAQFASVVRRHGRAFYLVEAWEEECRRYDLVAGLRFHGVMVGVQTGVPGVLFAHDARTLELAEATGIPHVLLSDVGPEPMDAVDAAMGAFDPDAFDARRAALAGLLVDALGAFGVAPRDSLRALA